MKEQTVEQVAQAGTSIFDLGFEVLIVPVLWAALIITVLVLLITSISRVIVSTDENGFSKKKFSFDKSKGLMGVSILVIGGLILASLVVTPPGHRAAIYSASGGVLATERSEGVSFVVPVFQNANMVDVRVQKYQNTEIFAQTKNLQEVTMQVTVNYRVNPNYAAEVFQNIGQEYERVIIEPAVLDEAKVVAGEFNAEDVPANRSVMAEKMLTLITAHVNKNLGEEGLDASAITVTSVALEDTIFADEFVAAVLAKEVAKEERAAAVIREETATAEGNAVFNKANGEASAAERLAEAADYERELLNLSPEEYVWYKVWNGVLPQFVGGGGLDFILDSSVLNANPSTEEPGADE